MPVRVVASKLEWKNKTLVVVNAHNFGLSKQDLAVIKKFVLPFIEKAKSEPDRVNLGLMPPLLIISR